MWLDQTRRVVDLGECGMCVTFCVIRFESCWWFEAKHHSFLICTDFCSQNCQQPSCKIKKQWEETYDENSAKNAAENVLQSHKKMFSESNIFVASAPFWWMRRHFLFIFYCISLISMTHQKILEGHFQTISMYLVHTSFDDDAMMLLMTPWQQWWCLWWW